MRQLETQSWFEDGILYTKFRYRSDDYSKTYGIIVVDRIDSMTKFSNMTPAEVCSALRLASRTPRKELAEYPYVERADL